MVDRRKDAGSGGSSRARGEDAVGGDLDLPGDMLDDMELKDPGTYRIAADETEAEELTDPASESEDDGQVEIDDPEQLAGATSVAQVARSARPQRRTAPASTEVARKATATPRRRQRAKTVQINQRTTPAQFTRESVDELKKVVWPTGTQVRQYFSVVLVFVLFIIAYVGLLDLGFGAALLRLFG